MDNQEQIIEGNNVADLLKPRIKVIAPMPLMKNKVGDFLYRQEYKDRFSFGIKTSEAEHFYPLSDFKLWPYIFHICEWWEDREEKDMPQYVSYVSLTLKGKYGNDESKTRKFVKIEKWEKDKNEWYYNGGKYFNTLCKSHLPASESEYLNQNKKL